MTFFLRRFHWVRNPNDATRTSVERTPVEFCDKFLCILSMYVFSVVLKRSQWDAPKASPINAATVLPPGVGRAELTGGARVSAIHGGGGIVNC